MYWSWFQSTGAERRKYFTVMTVVSKAFHNVPMARLTRCDGEFHTASSNEVNHLQLSTCDNAMRAAGGSASCCSLLRCEVLFDNVNAC